MATDLAARIGGRRPLYGNLTWTRPGLEEEEKARLHKGPISFGKGHRLSAQKSSWDRAPVGYDSEASSLNDEDMDIAQPDDTTSNSPPSPKTPSKPRFLRDRFTSGKSFASPGTLMERLGMAWPPEDESAMAINAVPNYHTNGAESGSNERLAVGSNVDEGIRPAAAANSRRLSELEPSLFPPPSSKSTARAVPDEGPEEFIAGLNISRTHFGKDSNSVRIEPVDEGPHSLDSGSSKELIDNMRQLLVPLVVKKAEREAASDPNYNSNDESDLAQKARSLITDDICEDFIRQAIASSSALEQLPVKEPPQPRNQDAEMSIPTRASTSVPPGLGTTTQSVGSAPAPAIPAVASRSDGLADSGKTVLPSHPLPTGPRSKQVEKRVASNHRDGREVLGSPRASLAHSAKGKEREWDMDNMSASQDRYCRFRQSPQSRRSRSPRSISVYRRSGSPSGSLSKSVRKGSPPGRSRRDMFPAPEEFGESRPRSRSSSFARYNDRERARRPAQFSPSSSYNDYKDRGPTRRTPSPRDRKERDRQPSFSYDSRDRMLAQPPSPWYDSQDRYRARRLSPPDEGRQGRGPRESSPSYSYGARDMSLKWRASPSYDSRYVRASSPRHSVSSSKGQAQARSPARGRSPPLLVSAQSTSPDKATKRKNYSPVARDGPPRGWSREPPARAPPDGPFPKKSKHEHDYDHPRSNYERPALSPTSALKTFGHDTRNFSRESPRKYQHICHRPAGYRCDHASHKDDSEQRRSPDHRPSSEATWENCRYDRPPPGTKIAKASDFVEERRPKVDPFVTPEGRGSPPIAHATPAANASPRDVTMTSTSPKPDASFSAPASTIDVNLSQAKRLGDSAESIVSPIPGLGSSSTVKVEQIDDGSVWDTISGFNPPGLVAPVPGLSAASTMPDIPSDTNSLASSSSETMVHHGTTPPSRSPISLYGQPKGESMDRKPDIKVLEDILASVKQEEQRLPPPLHAVLPDHSSTTAMPVVSMPPPLPQRGVPFARPAPPLPQRGVPFARPAPPLPQRDVPSAGPVPPLPQRGAPAAGPIPKPFLVHGGSAIVATPSPYHTMVSSQTMAPSSPASFGSTPVRIKVEDVETGHWPVEPQQLQSVLTTQAQSRSLIASPLDQATGVPNQQSTMARTGPPFPSDSLSVGVSMEPLGNLASVKKEPESTRNVISSVSNEKQIPEAVLVPGVWLVQQGASSVKTVDRSFHIEGGSSREWDIPMQSDSDDTAPESGYGDVTLVTKPKFTLQLLCFLTDKLTSVDWRGNPQAIWELPQTWPMAHDLIIVSNHDTPGQRVWMSHDLPKKNGSGRPVLLERHIYSGLNTLRIIQLTDLSKFTFVLIAKPDTPSPGDKSENSAADRFDDYFAKLRGGLWAKPQGKGRAPSPKPAAGSVTVQQISSDEEL